MRRLKLRFKQAGSVFASDYDDYSHDYLGTVPLSFGYWRRFRVFAAIGDRGVFWDGDRHITNTISHPLFLHSAARFPGWEMGKTRVR